MVEPPGEVLVESIISLVRGCGGFRPASSNFVGADTIENAIAAFRAEGINLASNGELQPMVLENLTGAAFFDALKVYIRRAQRGADDAALLTGTGKDLLEATAAHILMERYGSYPRDANFQGLLGRAFVALGLVTPKHPVQVDEVPQCKLERAMFELACSTY